MNEEKYKKALKDIRWNLQTIDYTGDECTDTHIDECLEIIKGVLKNE